LVACVAWRRCSGRVVCPQHPLAARLRCQVGALVEQGAVHLVPVSSRRAKDCAGSPGSPPRRPRSAWWAAPAGAEAPSPGGHSTSARSLPGTALSSARQWPSRGGARPARSTRRSRLLARLVVLALGQQPRHELRCLSLGLGEPLRCQSRRSSRRSIVPRLLELAFGVGTLLGGAWRPAPRSPPVSRAHRHATTWFRYRPARCSSEPFAPRALSLSYSSTMASFDWAQKRRRAGFATGSPSGTLPSWVRAQSG